MKTCELDLGASFAQFVNIVHDGAVHEKLQDRETFVELCEYLPDLKTLLEVDHVKGMVPKTGVTNYTIKHVVSSFSEVGQPLQRAHPDISSDDDRLVVHRGSQCTTERLTQFEALNSEGILHMKTHVLNFAISNGAGNDRVRKMNAVLARDICSALSDGRGHGFVGVDGRFHIDSAATPLQNFLPAAEHEMTPSKPDCACRICALPHDQLGLCEVGFISWPTINPIPCNLRIA